MSIGEKVKRLRINKGWTQKELADKIDRKQNTISYIENGGGAESDTIRVLADIFQVSIEYLINDDIDTKENIADTKECEFTLNLIKAVLNDKNMNKPEDLTKEKMEYIEVILKKFLENKANKNSTKG